MQNNIERTEDRVGFRSRDRSTYHLAGNRRDIEKAGAMYGAVYQQRRGENANLAGSRWCNRGNQ